ncbi:phosphate transporter PHO1 homolog 9-like [Pistacia vera]|uniref:phosphate transporter PHO1 homolog 9-like n=1 Tax=Pistacia vera TaxID=55513 RepID=UPI00126386EA|nr:phosphate transporter PHO1 homolog 9-like [Pistacia vera]
MKFGKEFSIQLVQEWQDAYMDYNGLKQVLKQVLHLKDRQQEIHHPLTSARGSFRRRVSLYRAFSGLTSKCRLGSPRKGDGGGGHVDDEVILVSSVDDEGSEDGKYQTMFLMPSDEGGEYELVFFRKLDDEFNKVVNFYKKKVNEVMVEADELSKQMNAFIALRIRVENPVLGGANLSSIHPVDATKQGEKFNRMETIQEVEMSSEEQPAEGESGRHQQAKADMEGFRPPSLRVLDHVRINVEPESPVSTLKGVLKTTNDKRFSKRELKKAETLMTQAFIEFYNKLRLMKSFSFLNQLAFSKILKKYDKIAARNASKTYLEMIDNSYLGSSDEVSKLMERVEATFVKHFANGNHRKGMDILRPKFKRERHTITFFLGVFFGFSLALSVGIIVSIHARNVVNSPGRHQYMENIFPLYSFFGYIFLHLFMYAVDIYYWNRYRVNYAFIFGFKQGTELGFREVLLLSSGLAVITFAGVVSNLDMEMDPRTRSFRAITELVPLGLLLVVGFITFCPFNIIYRSSRFFLIRCIFHCICAPLYKVTLPDFFLADQFTSQVQAIRSLQFYICYYGWGDYKRRSNSCKGNEIYRTFYLIVATIPYWIRFLQCARRLIEEKDSDHAVNGLKYFSTIVAVATRTTFAQIKTGNMMIAAAVTSVFATCLSTYWDLVKDWGLLRRDSKNPWLRDKLLVPNKSVYFIAMVVNVILRLAWVQSVFGFTDAPYIHRKALTAIVAVLEIFRRGMWNFFRLENEHLNNVGKYRAFKSVPLPFNYEDEDKDL